MVIDELMVHLYIALQHSQSIQVQRQWSKFNTCFVDVYVILSMSRQHILMHIATLPFPTSGNRHVPPHQTFSLIVISVKIFGREQET